MLDQLETEEQELLAQLKSLRAQRALQEQAEAEQAQLALQAKHAAHLEQVAALRPVTVLSVTYESLRKARKATSVRFIQVHPDILKLLRAALPAANEEQFCELCSALVSKLIGYGPAIEAIYTLRVASETARYFDLEQQTTLVVLTCEGRLAGSKNDRLADTLTAWALSWGSATQYEENEVSE
jgi:hypothetical protein